jgi:hypothetical protein
MWIGPKNLMECSIDKKNKAPIKVKPVENILLSTINQILLGLKTKEQITEWDFELEDTTLGGALTVRCEIEMFARYLGQKHISMSFSNFDNFVTSQELVKNVMASSEIDFDILNLGVANGSYPKSLMEALSDYSYFSSSRITSISSVLNLKPELKWKNSVDAYSKLKGVIGTGEYAAIHLKTIGSYENSRANMRIWMPLINDTLNSAPIPLLLLGDDDYPEELLETTGIIHLKKYSFPLMAQLSLVPNAKFFVGTASGVAAAAMYSNTPYMIFKNPKHHTLQMDLELGGSKSFPWAGQNQFLIRENPSSHSIKNFIGGL